MLRRTALALPLAVMATGAKAQEMRLLAPGTLRIGTYFVNPPFEFVDKGQNVGFEVDLMNEIAARLKLRPVYVNTTWEVILQQMQDGLYDCIVGGITITPERDADAGLVDALHDHDAQPRGRQHQVAEHPERRRSPTASVVAAGCDHRHRPRESRCRIGGRDRSSSLPDGRHQGRIPAVHRRRHQA